MPSSCSGPERCGTRNPATRTARLAILEAPVVLADGQHDEAIKQSLDTGMAQATPGPLRHVAEAEGIQSGGTGVSDEGMKS
jgi:hypothetical protein